MLSGQTSHPLNRFVLGGAQLGLRYGVTNSQMFDRRAAIAVVEAALDRGVECIDTAHAYGESEEVIGEVLQRRNVDPIRIVVTKIDPLDGCNLRDVELVRKRLWSSIEASRTRLQADQLGTVLLHREGLLDESFPWIMDTMVEARGRGLLTGIGVSVSNPDGLQRALENSAIMHVQLPFNILDDRWALADIPDRITVHCRSIFLQGALLDNANLLPMAGPVLSEMAFRVVDELVASLDYRTRLELLLDFVKSHQRINGVVVGAVVKKQLNEILDSWFLGRRMSAAQITSIRSRFAGLPNATLDPSRWVVQNGGSQQPR